MHTHITIIKLTDTQNIKPGLYLFHIWVFSFLVC